MASVFNLFRIILLLGNAVIVAGLGWGNNDKIRLTDVNAITLQHGRMTSSRRTSPVPQVKCVGGSAGCSSFTPQTVQCYNRGSDGYDVQWECKTDMPSQYRFGEISVSCEGYDYPDDPYVLKGSCGLEYTIDYVGGGNQNHGHSYNSDYRDSRQHGGHRKSYFSSGSWFGTIVMWGVIALIAYYIYTHMTSSTPANQYPSQPTAGHTQYPSPPPAGFRPEYVPNDYTSSSGHHSGPSTGGGFWSGAATGGILGYLFGNSGRRSPYYNDYGRGYGPSYHHRSPGYGFGGGGGWFGSGGNSWSSGWSSGNTARRSPSPPSTRTASGFGGTKRR